MMCFWVVYLFLAILQSTQVSVLKVINLMIIQALFHHPVENPNDFWGYFILSKNLNQYGYLKSNLNLHAVLFIRNIVKICLVSILIFCLVVSYFWGHILASCFLIFMHKLWKNQIFCKTVNKYVKWNCFASSGFLGFE